LRATGSIVVIARGSSAAFILENVREQVVR